MRRITTITYLKALARAWWESLFRVVISAMYLTLSITMGVCILLIIGAMELALSITPFIPASLLIGLIYFSIRLTFGTDLKISIDDGKG